MLKKIIGLILLGVILALSSGAKTPSKTNEEYAFPIARKKCIVRRNKIALSTVFYDLKDRTGKILKKGRQHHDIPALNGSPIFALGDGWIEETGFQRENLRHSAGAYLVLKTYSGLKAVYGHCRRKNSFAVLPKQKVRKNQTIAFVGNTGTSTGNHLHLKVFLIDKEAYKREHGEYLKTKIGQRIYNQGEVVNPRDLYGGSYDVLY